MVQGWKTHPPLPSPPIKNEQIQHDMQWQQMNGGNGVLFLGNTQTPNNGALQFCSCESKVTLCIRRNYHLLQVVAASALHQWQNPKSAPNGPPPSLSGAAAWRPLGDVTLTLNQLLEGHQPVFQSWWSMTSRQARFHSYVIWWFR